MKRKSMLITLSVILVLVSLVLGACAPPTPKVVKETVVVTKEVPVKVTKIVEKERVIKEGGDVYVGAGGAFTAEFSFNPLSTTGPRAFQGVIFNKLVRYSPDQKIIPDLAESWEVSEDGRIITFHLRHDVKWHDGAPFTAKDVEFSLRRYLDKRANSAWYMPLLSIVGAKEYHEGDPELLAKDEVPGIRIVNDYTVQLTLKSPSPSLLAALCGRPIMPEHILGAVPPEEIEKTAFATSHPVGTGPFKFVSLVPEQYVEFVRNDDYFRGAPHLDKIYYVFAEYDVAKLMMQKGELDMMRITAPVDIPWFEELENVNVTNVGSTWYYIVQPCVDVSCNPRIAPKELRQAMLYALDRDALNEAHQLGLGKVLNTLMLPPWALEGCELPNDYTYNPEKAKELLASINWDPEQELLMTSTGGWREKLATAMQQMWKDVGIRVKIETVDWATWAERMKKGELGLFIGWPEQGADPDMASIYFGDFPPEGNNQARYRNPHFDELWSKGRATTDREERKKIYCEIAKIFNEDLPWLPLFTDTWIFATSTRLRGVKFGTNAVDFGWDYNPEEWYISEE